MNEAVRIAMTEPQGPVHLDLPEDVALAEAQGQAEDRKERYTPSSQPANTTTAAELLRKAKHPIAVIGSSAMHLRDIGVLRAVIERHRIPFTSTTMAKGLIDETHPLSLGCIERARRQLQRRFIQEHADLIVGLGYDTVEVEYEAWTGNVPVLHVGIERADVDASVNLVHEVIGDLDASLAAIAELPPIQNAWAETAVSEHRIAFQRALRPATARFSPHEAVDCVRRTLPQNGVLAFDVGAHTHQIASQWTAHAPRTFLVTNGWSSMGFGLPAAIAAKLARPDLPVVCIVGDGCFQMTCGELAVARRENLAIPFVVLDDGWLSLIKVKQERRSLPTYGTPLGASETSPAPAPHYFGVPAMRVATAEQLERELARAFGASGPTVIEALVDPAEYSETVYD
jgi:acetolactate synthase-1/2/3 large subunit